MTKNQEIYLRKPIINDVDFMLQMENDPEIWQVSQTVEPFSRSEIENFIRNSKHDLIDELQLRYIVILTDTNKQIGSIDLFEFDADRNCAGVGITILSEYRGRSFGSQALESLIEEAFQNLKLKELFCNIFTNNMASIRLFESKGFQKVKLLKKHTEIKGQAFDEYLYRLMK